MNSHPYSLTTNTTKEYYRLMLAGLNAGLGLTCLHQIKPPIETEEPEGLTLNPDGSLAHNPDDSQTINPEAT